MSFLDCIIFICLMIYYFSVFIYLWVCVWVHMSHSTCAEIRGQLGGVCSVFHHVGPRDRTRATRVVPTDIRYRTISQTHLVYVLRQGPLLISSVGLGRLANELQGFSCLCASLRSPGTGLNHHARSVLGFS